MHAVWGAEEEKSMPGQLSAIGSEKAICWHGMLPSYDEPLAKRTVETHPACDVGRNRREEHAQAAQRHRIAEAIC